jgi:N-acetylneuraminic acid mutarotase
MPVFERTVNFFSAAGMDGGQALEWNKKMYFTGGFNGTIYNGGTFMSPNGQEIFVENAHNAASSYNGRAYHRMVLHDNRLFITGGFDGAAALNDCWMYNGSVWTRVATNIGGARYGHLMWSFDNRLFIAGGNNGSAVLSDIGVV